MTTQPNNENRAQADGMLAGYLAVLTASLPVSDREMFEEEARNHLSEHAAAYEELGHEPIEAMRTAIDRFGMPMRLARALTAEVTEPEPLAPTHQLASIHVWGAAVSLSAVLLANSMVINLHLGWQLGDGWLTVLAFFAGAPAAEFVIRTRMNLLRASLLTGAAYAAVSMNLAQALGGRVTQDLAVPYGLAGVATAVFVYWINHALNGQKNSHAERA